MSELVDCSTCNAETARNYFYDGFPILLPKERLIPFLSWLEKNYIDIKHDATPHKKRVCTETWPGTQKPPKK